MNIDLSVKKYFIGKSHISIKITQTIEIWDVIKIRFLRMTKTISHIFGTYKNIMSTVGSRRNDT